MRAKDHFEKKCVERVTFRVSLPSYSQKDSKKLQTKEEKEMENKREKENERMFHKDGFDFKKFEKMAEMMKSCCTRKGGMVDCCSMMKEMMEKGKGKETGEKNKDTEKRE